MNRRDFVQNLACGVGGFGLASVLADDAPAGRERQRPAARRRSRTAPRAKALIFLNMMGVPSQFETFDYKPEMAKYDGKDPPNIVGRQEGTVRFTPGSKITAPLFKYLRSKTGEVATTEVFPHTAGVLDELCVIRSMVADAPDHPGGQRQAMTGYARAPMPSVGSWLLYGLGSGNKNLPGFVNLGEGVHHGSGFLPGETQGMPVGPEVPNLKHPGTITEGAQREQLDLLGALNRDFAGKNPGADPLDARIEAAELAFRMQMSCPEAVDLSRESKATLDLHGVIAPEGARGRERGKVRGLPQTNVEFATMCLTARRLVERGVRVVTLCVGGRRGWDQHKQPEGRCRAQRERDRPGHGRAAHRPEARRAARQHAGDVGRRVRAHPLTRRTATAATTSRRGSPTGSRAAARRRVSTTARRTRSARRSPRTRSTSATRTRPFFNGDKLRIA